MSAINFGRNARLILLPDIIRNIANWPDCLYMIYKKWILNNPRCIWDLYYHKSMWVPHMRLDFTDNMHCKVFSVHQSVSPSCATLRNPLIDLTYTAERNLWLNSLIHDAVVSVNSPLAQADERGKHLLLEGWICDEYLWACWSGGKTNFTRPLWSTDLLAWQLWMVPMVPLNYFID